MPKPYADLMAVIWERTEPIPHSGCLIYMGNLNKRGYGRIGSGKRQTIILVHRAAYERLVGPIPEGLELDHKCRVPSCWNPAHLEPVTHAANVQRGWLYRTPPDACEAGHPYAPENTYLWRGRTRHCRICARARGKAFRDRRRIIKQGLNNG